MNIGAILKKIAGIISQGLKDKELNVGDSGIQLTNISFTEIQDLKSNISMSLVNVEEEKSLRYAQTRTVNHTDANIPQVFTHNPVVFLNLFIMFSFPRSSSRDDYLSLNLLGGLVRFLQHKNIFTKEEISLPDTETIPDFDKVVFELYSLSFEQMNHLWGVLGGKYIPSIMYKVRLFPIKETPDGAESLIKRQLVNNNE